MSWGPLVSISSALLPTYAGEDVRRAFDEAAEELREWESGESERKAALKAIRDQWEGEARATSGLYHPDIENLTADQAKAYRRILRDSHVNLIETAVDRLTNSIHAGMISRRSSDARLGELLRRPEHAKAMAQLCENATGYGTGYLVPILRQAGGATVLRYWLPDPLNTILVTEPGDVTTPVALIEVTRTGRRAAVRFLTEQTEGLLLVGDAAKEPYTASPHGLGFLPAVVAYGRCMTHRGKKYGRSLVATLPAASIKVTRNEANLELLRDRQTQALLVVTGEPVRTSEDEPSASNKFVQFPRDGGTANYETPDSRLEDVIRVGERQLNNAAVSSGLPLDTFRPELVQGSDASATAARIRAFPLQQRMVRLGNDWEMVERRASTLMGALMLQGAGEYVAAPIEVLEKQLGISVTLRPSLPEAESETLSNWQQKIANFLAPVDDAIEYYSGHLSELERGELARAWAMKHDPRNSSEADEELAAFKRDIAKALYSGATTKEVMANLTNLRELVLSVGLPREADYVEPFLPVIAPAGQPVSGDVLRDSDGDIVGGAVLPTGTNPAGGKPSGEPKEGDEQ